MAKLDLSHDFIYREKSSKKDKTQKYRQEIFQQVGLMIKNQLESFYKS